MTSMIVFCPIYLYYLKMERNLFIFHSLFSSSWFWDFKTSRPAAKKRSEQPFFSDIFEGLFLGGQAPSTAPILCFVNLIILNGKQSKPGYSNKKKKQKGTWFLNLLGRLKFWPIYKKTKCLNVFFLQIVWIKKNQPADLRSNKITDDQDKEDQIDEEDLSLVLNIFPKSLYYIK